MKKKCNFAAEKSENRTIMNSTNFDIFISYKRKSLPTANNLYYRLTIRGYSTFFDLEEMGRDNFNTQLLNYIENAKDVFVLLEEGSLDACKRDDWEKDWFCQEIAFALEKKKNIIPVLLNDYRMPPEEFFPDKMKEFHLKSAPEFNFTFFEAYLDKLVENNYLLSKPNIQEKVTSVFKFYSNENCQVYKEGKLVCSLEGGSDEPYYLPVSRKGDFWFKVENSISSETKLVKEQVEVEEEKIVEIQWSKKRKKNKTWKVPAKKVGAVIVLMSLLGLFMFVFFGLPKRAAKRVAEGAINYCKENPRERYKCVDTLYKSKDALERAGFSQEDPIMIEVLNSINNNK